METPGWYYYTNGQYAGPVIVECFLIIGFGPFVEELKKRRLLGKTRIQPLGSNLGYTPFFVFQRSARSFFQKSASYNEYGWLEGSCPVWWRFVENRNWTKKEWTGFELRSGLPGKQLNLPSSLFFLLNKSKESNPFEKSPLLEAHWRDTSPEFYNLPNSLPMLPALLILLCLFPFCMLFFTLLWSRPSRRSGLKFLS